MNTITISAKCSDLFWARHNGKEYDGYVPDWFPTPAEKHYGDYVSLDIDLDTGRILNWKKPTQAQLKETFKQPVET